MPQYRTTSIQHKKKEIEKIIINKYAGIGARTEAGAKNMANEIYDILMNT